jgi:uncharacterized protein with FMN-binding domain
MRKGIVTILAVAIIGALGVYGKSHSTSNQSSTLGTSSGASQPASSSSGSSRSSTAPANSSSASFKDGAYTGDSEGTAYGTVQIAVVISGGKITDVKFLQMPNDLGHTQEVTAAAEPLLKEITLQKQSSHIDFVTGATQTSEGYQQSLQAALNQAA